MWTLLPWGLFAESSWFYVWNTKAVSTFLCFFFSHSCLTENIVSINQQVFETCPPRGKNGRTRKWDFLTKREKVTTFFSHKAIVAWQLQIGFDSWELLKQETIFCLRYFLTEVGKFTYCPSWPRKWQEKTSFEDIKILLISAQKNLRCRKGFLSGAKKLGHFVQENPRDPSSFSWFFGKQIFPLLRWFLGLNFFFVTVEGVADKQNKRKLSTLLKEIFLSSSSLPIAKFIKTFLAIVAKLFLLKDGFLGSRTKGGERKKNKN